MYGYVYITFNQINSKFYVGIHKKKTFTDTYKGSGLIIKKAIQKYGKENFETLLVERCETIEELNKAEIYWIAEFKRIYGSENSYNIQVGGNIPTNKGKPISKKQREIISKCMKGRTGELNGMYGKHPTEETKELMRQAKIGKYDGKNNPNYGIKRKHIWKDDIHKYVKIEELQQYLDSGWVEGPSYNHSRKGIKTGKHLSEETKHKISISQKARLNKLKSSTTIENTLLEEKLNNGSE